MRADARIHSMDEIGHAVVATRRSIPVTINDVAKVRIGGQFRTGAASKNGREVVIGTALMLTGENSRTVASSVREKFLEVRNNLPPGIVANVLLDRSQLVNATITTVAENLAIGALLVIATLFLLLGNARAALIATLVIPLSFAMAATGMNALGVPANLMSLGALDFGLIIDGAIIIVENTLRRIAEQQKQLGRPVLRRRAAGRSAQSVRGDGAPNRIWADCHLPRVCAVPGVSGRGRQDVLAHGHHADAGACFGVPAIGDVRSGHGGDSFSRQSRGTRGCLDSCGQAPLQRRPCAIALAHPLLVIVAGVGDFRRCASSYSVRWVAFSSRRSMRSTSIWPRCASRRFRWISQRTSISRSSARC